MRLHLPYPRFNARLALVNGGCELVFLSKNFKIQSHRPPSVRFRPTFWKKMDGKATEIDLNEFLGGISDGNPQQSASAVNTRPRDVTDKPPKTKEGLRSDSKGKKSTKGKEKATASHVMPKSSASGSMPRAVEPVNHPQQEISRSALEELKSLQQESMSSMNDMIANLATTISNAIKQNANTTGVKRRCDFSDSEYDDDSQDEIDLDSSVQNLLGNSAESHSDNTDKQDTSKHKDEVLEDMSKFLEETDTVSENTDENLADFVDKMLHASVSDEKTKTQLEKYNRPQNCKNLISTKVNTEI